MADDHLEELRIALVMNGGVSLAVWMGGVSNEIFRLVKERHPVYAALLDLTHSTARVDVISGTSAGGVNGAALALALIYGSEYSMLRDVWKEMGAFDELLRPPLGHNPGSLLRGDDYFLPQIEDAFGRLARLGESRPDEPATVQSMPIDLRMTTTLLEGRLACTVDDLGTHVGDKDHRARFRFRHVENAPDHFSDRRRLVACLSRAARSTASFPFAFEPSKVPAGESEADCGGIYDVTDKRIDGAHYVVDGGILDNKPFHGALQSIFQMKTQRSVRRVLAYINPDPGTDAQLALSESLPTASDGTPRLEADPALASVLVSSLFAIPQAQTILDQLNEIQAHNNRVRARRHRVSDLVQQLTPYDPDDPCDTPDNTYGASRPAAESLAADLFKLYRRRRFAHAFDDFAYRLLPAVATKDEKLSRVVVFLGKNASRSIRLKFEEFSCREWYPRRWLRGADDPSYSNSEYWRWGSCPADFAAKITLDLLMLTHRLEDISAVQADAERRMRERTAGLKTSVDDRSWADPDYSSWLPKPPASAGNPDLLPLWNRAYEALELLNGVHADEQAMWIARIKALLPDAAAEIELPTDAQLARLFALVDVERWDSRCAAIMYRFAEVIDALCPIARRAIANIADHVISDGDQSQISRVKAFANYFAPLADGAKLVAVNDTAAVVRRLLQLEVIDFALHDRTDLEDDQLIELVQISGNSTSPLGGRTRAADKLLGLQLAHFAAFYKSSWRMNDWTYGRLDGAERLVKVLLNPERLLRVFRDPAKAVEAIRRIAVEVPSAELRVKLEKEWEDRFAAGVAAELGFLGKPNGSLPDQLVHCADAITMRLHYGILEEEIRHIYNAIIEDQSKGADASGDGQAYLQKLALGRTMPRNLPDPTAGQAPDPRNAFSLEQAQGILRDGLIGGERLVDEAGSDLFTRTFAHALASLQGTLANKQTRLGPVSALFASLRVPILGFYFVAKGLTRQNRTSAALNAGILAIGAIIVALQLLLIVPKGMGAVASAGGLSRDTLPSVIVTLGWALLAYGVPRVMFWEGLLITLLILAGAWYFDAASIFIGLILLFGLVLSVWWLPLQWPLGFVVIIGAALWSVPETRNSVVGTCRGGGLFTHDCWTVIASDRQVLPFATVIVIVLIAAMWYSSFRRKSCESWIRNKLRARRLRAYAKKRPPRPAATVRRAAPAKDAPPVQHAAEAGSRAAAPPIVK
jgi:patatin-related protein